MVISEDNIRFIHLLYVVNVAMNSREMLFVVTWEASTMQQNG